MNLPRFSVRNPVAVNLLMVAIVVGGLVAWMTLVREFFPKMESEQLLITVPYPGATPEEIERSVARVIEREVEDVDGVEEIRSRVFEGITLIVLKLEDGADRDRALRDVQAELDKAKPELPDGAEEPELAESRPFIPAIALVLHGNVSERQLRDVVDSVRDDLLDMSEITEVVVTGIRKREFTVQVLPELLEEHGLTLADVGQALRARNIDIPGGQLKSPRANVRVRTMGETRIPHELEALPIRTTDAGVVLRVGDVARVHATFEDKVESGRWEGQRSATLTVFKTPEQDAIKIAQAVRAYQGENPTVLGGAVSTVVTTDLSRLIEGRLDLMTRNAQAGLILVLLVLAVFLEVRVAFWVAIGLGVSFMGTFVLMGIFDQSVNLISLFGLIVVLGLIVDDAIVIAENIFSRQRSGNDPRVAAIEGAGRVGLPVVAAVMTTVAAFAPLMFMEGRIGAFLGVLPVVVIMALSVSLLEGFLILPSHLAHKSADRPPRTRIGRLLRRARDARHRFFEHTLPQALGRALDLLLRWRYVTIAVSVGLLMVTTGLVAGGVVPFVLLQNVDAETITAKLEMAAGTPEGETAALLDKVAMAAAAQPEVKSVFSVLGASFSERGRETPSDPAVVGQITIELTGADIREARNQRKSTQLVSDLRAETTNLPGVRRLSYQAQSGGPGGADLEVRLRSDDIGALSGAVDYVEERIANYAGIDEIYNDLERGKLEARLRIRDDARLTGLTTRDLAVQFRNALFGFEVQDLQIDNDDVTVRVMLTPEARQDLEDLGTLRVATPTGARVPLEEAATISTTRGYATIVRVDGKRAVTVTASVDETRGNVAEITAALGAELSDLGRRFPGVVHSFEGRRKDTNESVGSLRVLFPIALGLIFCIIAVLFRSYVQPIIVMSVIPFSLIGVVFGHALMGYPFTILSMIGMVALAGIVVNDGLILVDLANRYRRRGRGVLESVRLAAMGRMRAILLTSITTCVGLAPLMLERSFQAQFLIPMAVSIVFGLAFATLLVLLLLPAFYVVMEDLRACLRWIATGHWHRGLPYDPALAMDREADRAGRPTR